MRADVSVDCLANSAELIAAGVGHLDVKSCPSSCLSAAVCLRFLEGDGCQHFCCLSLSVRCSNSVLDAYSSALVGWLGIKSGGESFLFFLSFFLCC